MSVKSKKKIGKDTAVQGTNDSSVVSKVSAAAKGYFQDDYIQHFVCKVARRAPLINRGYYVRWKAVDHCVKRFIEKTVHCPKIQILSLGAGFDSLYFRLQSNGDLLRAVVFEVDFPEVARRKSMLIKSNVILREKMDPVDQPPLEPLYLYSPQYRLLGVDVRELSQLEKALESSNFEWTAPTLVLSEVVLTYMQTKWSNSVISWTADHLPQSLFVIYEQIHPSDPFGQIMQDHFTKLNSTLHAVQQYPDAKAQTLRFLDNGWDQCVCLDMNSFYFGLVPESEKTIMENLEPFDEYEEWHQKCSHYFILTASRGSLAAQAILSDTSLIKSQSFRPIALPVRTIPVRAEGLGMGSVSLWPNVVLLTGGSSKGGREAHIGLLLKNKDSWELIQGSSCGEIGVRLYHTVTCVPGKAAVVFGGRTSPLNPVESICKLTMDPWCTPDLQIQDRVIFKVKEVATVGKIPKPRWRHTTTLLSHKDKEYLFLFGGKNGSQEVFGDSSFLDLCQNLWTEMTIDGPAPEERFSHTACAYQGGVVIFGGLSRKGLPLGDTALLKPTDCGFCWDQLDIKPPPAARYSHTAHVIGENLLVVGGVWLHPHVPGVAVINLKTQSSAEYRLDTTAVPWPLMLHSFCSELTESKDELLLIGGGGNCFSFGTHLNPQPVVVDLRPISHLHF